MSSVSRTGPPPLSGYAPDATGQGCGGRMHPAEGCPTCLRRSADTPSWEWRRIGDVWAIQTPGYARVGGALAGGAGLVASVGIWRTAFETWQSLAALLLSLGSLPVLYGCLFTIRTIAIDPRGRRFVRSSRSLFSRPDDRVRDFSDLAFVGLDLFEERTFEDGRFSSRKLRANVWLEWLDGEVESFGSGPPAEMREQVEFLERLTEAPLRATGPQDSPTGDRWTVSSSE